MDSDDIHQEVIDSAKNAYKELLKNPKEIPLKLWLDIGRGCLSRLESQFSSLPMGEPSERDPQADEKYRLAQKGIKDAILGYRPGMKDNKDYMDGFDLAKAYEGEDKQAAKEVLMGRKARVTPVYAPRSFLNAAQRVLDRQARAKRS